MNGLLSTVPHQRPASEPGAAPARTTDTPPATPTPPARTPHPHWTLRIAVTEYRGDHGFSRTHLYDGIRTACGRTPHLTHLPARLRRAALRPHTTPLTCPGCARRGHRRPETRIAATHRTYRAAATLTAALHLHDPATATAACRLLAADPDRTTPTAHALAALTDGPREP